MHVRAVLFDLDGTLIDSHGLIIASFQHALRTVLDRDVSADAAQVRWGQPLATRFAAVAPEHVGALVEAYTAHYDAHEATLASVFPGVPGMLDALVQRGQRLAVVTSKRRRAAAQALRVLGLAPWFATALGAEDAPAPKPAPDPVHEALRRLGVTAEAALMVGDGAFDVRAAKAAGVRSAAALWGTRESEALLACDPDYVVGSPGEVVTLVESW